MNSYSGLYTNDYKLVIGECEKALARIDTDQIDRFIEEILKADRVFFVGVGRVLLSLKSIAKRLAHIGVSTVVVGQITEPAITNKDLLIVGSGSGETLYPVGIAKKAKEFGAKVVHIGANPNSGLTSISDIFVRIPVNTKVDIGDEIKSEQPMTSLFEQTLLLIGDVVAMMIISIKGLNIENLWMYHANLE